LGRRKKVVRKSGEEIMIYHDPFNNNMKEGKACLLRLVEKNKLTDIWWVVMVEDGFKCKRRIKHEFEPYKYKNGEEKQNDTK